MGYDTPKKLGDRETGGGLSLPIWIDYMSYALKGVPVTELPVPPGVVNVGGEWYYEEYARGSGVSRVGVQNGDAATAPEQPAPVTTSATAPIAVLPPADEKKRILDLFKN